jgi:pimeloyl-ACP methyl ester carboxylesterase
MVCMRHGDARPRQGARIRPSWPGPAPSKVATLRTMTTVLLFHHAQGLTPGVRAFADELLEAGHAVHTPDLYYGRTFRNLDGGVAYAKEVGFDEINTRASGAAGELPVDIVYGGFSLGGMRAQWLAQTRPGARGAILFHSCAPTSEFGSPWPANVPVQIPHDGLRPMGKRIGLRPTHWSRRPRTGSCSCTQGPATCSPTRASTITTSRQPACLGSARWPSWTGSAS